MIRKKWTDGEPVLSVETEDLKQQVKLLRRDYKEIAEVLSGV